MEYLCSDFKGLESAVETVLNAHPIESVSFDVFDTLLHRRCHPDAILYRLAQWMQRELQLQACSVVDILQERHLAYVDIAEGYARQGFDFDAGLEELITKWLERLSKRTGVSVRDAFDSVHQMEIQLEKLAVYPNDFSLNLVSAIAGRGLKLIYISDMYLGRNVIERLLDACGFGGMFTAGYVSGDHKRLKRTGNLFSLVNVEEQISPQKHLHIGDDRLADGVKGSESGYRSLWICDKKLGEKRQQDMSRLEQQRKNRVLLDDAVFSFCNAYLYPGFSSLDSYTRRTFGPALVNFSHLVVEKCVSDGIDRVYFVAREGFLLGRLFNELAPIVQGVNSIQGAHYLYISRLASLLASMDRLSFREIRSIADNVSQLTLKNLLAPLSLPESQLDDLALRCNIPSLDYPFPENYESWEPLQQLLGDAHLQAYVAEKFEHHNRLLIRMLEELGFFSVDRVAIIDVGWGGQIQENLVRAVKLHPRVPEINGYYLGSNAKARARRANGLSIESLLVEEGAKDWNSVAPFEFVQSFEALCRAPHATVVSYAEDINGCVVPVLKPEESSSRKAEHVDDFVICQMQKSMITLAGDYVRACQFYGANAGVSIRYARTALSNAILFPARSESAYLLSLKNCSDLGLDEIVGGQGLKEKKGYRLRDFYSHMLAANWEHGIFSQYFGTPLQIAYTAYRLNRILLRDSHTDFVGIAHDRALSELHCAANLTEWKGEKVIFPEIFISDWERASKAAGSGGMPLGEDDREMLLTVGNLLKLYLSYQLTCLFFLLRFKRPRVGYSGMSMRPMFSLWLRRFRQRIITYKWKGLIGL